MPLFPFEGNTHFSQNPPTHHQTKDKYFWILKLDYLFIKFYCSEIVNTCLIDWLSSGAKNRYASYFVSLKQFWNKPFQGDAAAPTERTLSSECSFIHSLPFDSMYQFGSVPWDTCHKSSAIISMVVECPCFFFIDTFKIELSGHFDHSAICPQRKSHFPRSMGQKGKWD